MIAPIDIQSWSPADLTGNSALVVVGQDLILVGGRRADGTIAVYRSTSHGASWAVVCTIPVPAGTTDPAVVLDAAGVLLHIVMGVPNVDFPDHIDIVKRKLNLSTYQVSSPVTLVSGSKSVSSYDITPVAGGGTLVVATAMEPITPIGQTGFYVLLAFEVATNDTFTATVLERNHWADGDTFGSVTLLVPISGPEEVYYTSHARTFTFKPTKVSINRRERAGAGLWGSATELTSYIAQFTDDKMTVVGLSDGSKVLAQAYCLNDRVCGMQSNLLYGVFYFNPVTQLHEWKWMGLPATSTSSYREPVIGTDGTGVFIAYLRCPRIAGARGYLTIGNLIVTELIHGYWDMEVVPGAWQKLEFRWLRGTKCLVDPLSKWLTIGVAGDTTPTGAGAATYISQYNLPPIPALTPTTLTLQRGITATLDATATVDPDLDSLTYTWSHNHTDVDHIHLTPIDDGKTASLAIDKTIGPAPTSFVVTLLVDDGVSGHQRSITCSVTVPFNAEPILTVPAVVDVLRNTTIFVTATATDSDNDPLSYLWQQLQGTPIILHNVDSSTVIADVYRMHPDGEDVVLRIIVQDGVNRPVFEDMILRVSAIPVENVDTEVLTKAFYTVAGQRATIAQRHTITGVWPTPQESELLSDLSKIEVVINSAGADRFCYTSDHTVQVVSQNDASVFYRSRTPPIAGEIILDSAHDELDQTYLLTNLGNLYRYTSSGPNGCSDWPDNKIQLVDLVQGQFTRLLVNPGSLGKRVIAFYGETDGLFLAHMQDQNFTSLNTLQINRASGIIPSDIIHFIRMDSVAGLNSGQMLIGLTDSTGATSEILASLATRRSIATWDRFNTTSTRVSTGEILAPMVDALHGTPNPPVIQDPERIKDRLYQINWTQDRPDLVVGYEIWLGLDAHLPTVYVAIPNGSTRKALITTKNGHTYHLTVRSQGSSGMSPFSDECTLTT